MITTMKENKLKAAVDEALRADKNVDAATAPEAYEQAMKRLSASISACAGEGLLQAEEVMLRAITRAANRKPADDGDDDGDGELEGAPDAG